MLEVVRLLSVVTIVVHEICTINGLSIANEDCVGIKPREIRVWISHSSLFSSGLCSGGRQAAEEI